LTPNELLEWAKAIGLPGAVALWLLYERVKAPKAMASDVNAALVAELTGIRQEVKDLNSAFGDIRERLASVEAIQDYSK